MSRLLLIGVLVFGSVAAFAEEPGLFLEPASERGVEGRKTLDRLQQQYLQSEPRPEVSRHRFARINLPLLRSVADGSRKLAGLPLEIRLNLFADQVVVGREIGFEFVSGDQFVWTGVPVDDPLGLMVLAAEDGRVSGSISTGGVSFA